ncbi:MAG: extracellular solute-binding protein [Patescibacteria group bacterium]|nr:extracellular solute-binding protein [Patescibacteria group bacterium]
MKFSKRQLIVIGITVVAVVGIISLFFLGGRKEQPPEVALTVWGTEPQKVLSLVFDEYHKTHSNVTVSYVQIPEETYQSQLLNALAAGVGPDVFMVGNRDLRRNLDKIVPAPQSVFTLAQLRSLFPSVIEDDFVRGGAVYALPLSIDTLALLYNKNLFDGAAIITPPETWDEFVRDIDVLRVRATGGGITRPATALGGSSRSVANSADIVQLLMLQNGAPLTDINGSTAMFGSDDKNKGLTAFNFYLQFANVGGGAYTWNDAMTFSRDAFAAGNVAMIVDYRSALAYITKKNPFLRVGTAPVPQVGGSSQPVSFARYNGFAVSKWSKWANDWAWNFVTEVTTNPALAGIYLASSGTSVGQITASPALRSEIAKYIGTPDMDVFARQALTARSWLSPGDDQIVGVFDDAIQSVLAGKTDSRTALRRAEAQVTQLLQSR